MGLITGISDLFLTVIGTVLLFPPIHDSLVWIQVFVGNIGKPQADKFAIFAEKMPSYLPHDPRMLSGLMILLCAISFAFNLTSFLRAGLILKIINLALIIAAAALLCLHIYRLI
jgi:hypothetical protein